MNIKLFLREPPAPPVREDSLEGVRAAMSTSPGITVERF
jgi:hypothetical protein